MNHKKIYPSYFLVIPLVLYVGIIHYPECHGTGTFLYGLECNE